MSQNRDIDKIDPDEVEQMIEEARRQGFLGEESISQVLGRIDGASESIPVKLLADQMGLPDSTVSGLLDSIREHSTAARKRKGDESGGSSSEISVGEMEILHSSTDLSSRYDHVCQINRGGMGEILSALDPHANREVAIKILPHERRDHLRACSKFLQEARLTAGLDHPNIVPIYEVGFSAEWGLYYSMKLVQGKTLAETLALCRSGGRLGVYGRGRALRDFLKVCEAMALAHSRGVIHRDLKPSNIMLGAFGEVVVMDWGLAKQIDTGRDLHDSEILGPLGVSKDSVTSGSSSPYTTVEGAVMGTAAYMPPEQASGQISEIDVRSDIYSLGAILYEILTLTPPFRGRNRNVLMDQVRSGKFESPGERAPEERVPRELESAVLKAMSRKKEERYEQVDALQADIEAFLEGRTLAAAEYTTWQRAIKWMSRNRMACVVGVGVFFIAVFFQLAQIGMDRWESGVRFREHVEEAHRYMKRTGSIEGLMAVGSEDGNLQALLDTESPEKNLRRRLAMGNYLAAARELERALRIQPEVHSVRSERIELGVAIGRMALAGKEYLLARRAFEELEAYGFSQDRSRLWQERVRTARSALLEERAHRLRFIIEDLGRGMARKGRPRDAPLLTDYVFESVTFRDRQTVEILGGLLNSLIRKKEGTPESLRAWTQNERDQATYACRVLGRLGFAEAVTPLSGWLDVLSDPERFQPGLRDSAMAVEAGLALCNTRRPESLASLLRARTRFGLNSPFWERIISRIGRVPVEGGLPDPTAADFFSRANLLLDQMRWDEAIEAFSRAIDRDPENSDLFNNRGIARSRQGDFEGAIKDYDQAIQLNPKRAHALNNRGECFAEIGRLQRAKRDFDRALEVDSQMVAAYINRGRWFASQGDFLRAAEDFQVAIRLEPDNAPVHNVFGLAWAAQGQYEKALASYAEALTRDPGMARAQSNRALSYYHLRRYEESVQAADEAIRIDPKLVTAYVNRAIARYAMGDLQGALSDFNRSIGLLPSIDATVYRNRAMVREDLKLRRGAIEDYREYLRRSSGATDRDLIEERLKRLEAGR